MNIEITHIRALQTCQIGLPLDFVVLFFLNSIQYLLSVIDVTNICQTYNRGQKLGHLCFYAGTKRALLRSTCLTFSKNILHKQLCLPPILHSNVETNYSFSERSPRLPSTLEMVRGDCMIDGLNICPFSTILAQAFQDFCPGLGCSNGGQRYPADKH